MHFARRKVKFTIKYIPVLYEKSTLDKNLFKECCMECLLSALLYFFNEKFQFL